MGVAQPMGPGWEVSKVASNEADQGCGDIRETLPPEAGFSLLGSLGQERGGVKSSASFVS